MDATARRLQAEMESALRHLRRQVAGWLASDARDSGEPGADEAALEPGEDTETEDTGSDDGGTPRHA